MAFTLDAFNRTQPFLFHLTAEGNLNGILHAPTLFPAATLLAVDGASCRVLRRVVSISISNAMDGGSGFATGRLSTKETSRSTMGGICRGSSITSTRMCSSLGGEVMAAALINRLVHHS